jgi:hypothetical protein
MMFSSVKNTPRFTPDLITVRYPRGIPTEQRDRVMLTPEGSRKSIVFINHPGDERLCAGGTLGELVHGLRLSSPMEMWPQIDKAVLAGIEKANLQGLTIDLRA